MVMKFRWIELSLLLAAAIPLAALADSWQPLTGASTLRKLAMDKHRTLGEVAGDVIAILDSPAKRGKQT